MAFQADEHAARLRAEFPRALRDGQVVGYFQPEVELSTGRLAAAELLARWEHPEHGTIPPTMFTALAEELGLMREFSLRMLRQALAQHRAWVAGGWVVQVAVNIGPSCVTDPSFPAAVAQLLHEEQVPGQMLALEVSEETGTTAASTRFFAQLAELRVQVALDDFGTGFASLESLGGWPINELKLDRSIVRPIITSASFRAIVGTTIDLAHQLGVKVVAEGVESAAISSELRALGCDVGQGFFLGRPMQASAFTDWLRDPARPVTSLEVSGYPQAGPPSTAAVPQGPAGQAAGSAVRLLRRAVQPIGGGTLAAAVAMLAVYGLWQVFRWGGHEHQALIGDLAFVPVNGAAAVLAWQVSRRAELGRHTRRAWRVLSVAIFLYLAGDLLQLFYEVVLHQRAYPTWADAAYLSFYAVAFCGLISFPAHRRSRPERLRLLLDIGTVFVGGAVLIWYVALGPAIASGPHFNLVDLATYAYPIGDSLLLFGILTVLWRGVPPSSVTALRIFAVGMLMYIAADLTYDYIIVHSTYLGGDPVDVLWMLALTLVFLATACQVRTKPSGVLTAPPPRSVPARPSFLPYLAIVSSYLLLALIGLRNVRFDPVGGILLGALLLTLIVSTRQYITTRDYGRLAARYQELAAIDGVTGLYNRRYFMETVEAAFAHAQRLGQPFAALMIDVDNFKQINDEHGHIAGDQVLAELAQACREHVRPEDIVGRYGGDEFIIMVPGITSLRAIQLADQLTRSGAHVLGRDGKPLAYTTSIGIAECPPGGDLPTLLMHADLAMYEAKQAGGGGWRVFGGGAAARPASTGQPDTGQAGNGQAGNRQAGNGQAGNRQLDAGQLDAGKTGTGQPGTKPPARPGAAQPAVGAEAAGTHQR
jgi:diguanylate cyclase (GGDEF)-like protein